MANQNHDHWMRLALEEAEKAMSFGEIPVATILVANGKEIGRGQTLVVRKGSIVAHGELFTLLEAKGQVWTAERPLVLYTTLEPCLMCLGASMQVGIDTIVYAMDAAPDGGTRFAADIRKGGQTVPEIIPHVLENEAVALMRRFLIKYPKASAVSYVKAMLAIYKGKK